jgi:hypothetical protein
MTGFDETALAARMRDAIHREAIKAVRSEVPPYRYGTVTQIDPDIRQVKVLFAGDPLAVTAKIVGIQPTAIGQVVQISGRTGDLFVSGVVGSSRFVDMPSDELTPPIGFTVTGGKGSVLLKWYEVPGIDKYEVQIAEDPAFNVVIGNYVVAGNGYLITELNTPQEYWVRVRSVNNVGEVSAWSVAESGTTVEFPGGDTSDGDPPTESPRPLVTGGFGYLLVEWLEIANNDLVVYDVHLSTQSGFTPNLGNKVGSTTGTFFFINASDPAVIAALASESGQVLTTEDGLILSLSGGPGASLDYDTIYFVRIVARDVDGSAPPSAQGSGSPLRIQAGDVGLIPRDAISDGLPPSHSPDVGTVTNGVGYLLVRWSHIVNPDGATYEVHVSSSSGFTPGPNTLVGDTPSNWFFIRNVGPGAGSGPLQYGTTYYVRIWARDNDGYASDPGAQGSGLVVRVSGVDIGPNTVTAEHMVANTITAASGIIADAAIGTAKIQEASITTAKIANASIITAHIVDASISTAKIQDAAISTAKIGNLQVTNAKIANLAVDDAKISDLSADKITTGFIDAARIEAGSISVDKLRVGNFANLIQNSGLENGTLDPHFPINGGGTWYVSGALAKRSGAYGLYYDATGQSAGARLNLNGGTTSGQEYRHVTAFAGEQLTFQAHARRLGTLAHGSIALMVSYFDHNFTLLSQPWQQFSSGQVSSTNFTSLSFQSTAPTGTVYAVPNIFIYTGSGAGSIWAFDDLSLRRVVGTDDLADLVVTSAKIGSAAVTTAHIQNAAITDAKIQSLSANKITAGTISATITMTSPNISAAGGAVNLNSSGLTFGDGSTFLAARARWLSGSATRLEIWGTAGISFWQSTGPSMIHAGNYMSLASANGGVLLLNAGGSYVRVVDRVLNESNQFSLIAGQGSATRMGMRAGQGSTGVYEIQVRPTGSTGVISTASYGMLAAVIRNTSARSYKDNVQPYNDSVLGKIMSTPVRRYSFTGVSAAEAAKMEPPVNPNANPPGMERAPTQAGDYGIPDTFGFVVDEMPVELQSGDGYLVGEVLGYLWKGLQELNTKVNNLPGGGGTPNVANLDGDGDPEIIE